MDTMRIEIEGTIPGNLGESKAAINLLGQLNMPCRFLRFTIDNAAYTTAKDKNDYTVPMHHFTIKGEEAANWAFLKFVMNTLKEAGALVNKAVAGVPHEGMQDLLKLF